MNIYFMTFLDNLNTGYSAVLVHILLDKICRSEICSLFLVSFFFIFFYLIIILKIIYLFILSFFKLLLLLLLFYQHIFLSCFIAEKSINDSLIGIDPRSTVHQAGTVIFCLYILYD